MTIERKAISELVAEIKGLSEDGLDFAVTDGNGGGRYVEIRHASGEVLAGVYFNDLFDADGNRFEDDLP